MEGDRTLSEWSIGTAPIKWSAVFGGWAVGLALQIVLTLAGLGFGAWAVDLHDANPTEGIPLGAAVWTAISMLSSAFVGGYLTARFSGTTERGEGLYHGVVVWGLNWLVLAWLTTTAMVMMIGGAFSVFGTALHNVVQGIAPTAAIGMRSAARVSLPVDDLRREIESVLRATGKPELQLGEADRNGERTAATSRRGQVLSRITDQSLAELRDALSMLDREAAVSMMVNRYGMSDAQAQDVVQSTIGLLTPAQDTLRSARQRGTAMSAEALDRLGMIALWLSGLGLISLAVSAIGGMVGIPEDALIESTAHTQAYAEIRRAG